MTRPLILIASLISAAAPHHKPGPFTHERRAYLHAYAKAVSLFGHRAPGCKLIGPRATCHVRVTDRRLSASLAVLGRMLSPPPTAPPSPTGAMPPPQSPTTAGAGGLPACASESGTNYSTGPANTNPSSGATGRYQIIPSTAAGYGCNLSTPAGQDACAQTIFRNQGAGAWVGCGG